MLLVISYLLLVFRLEWDIKGTMLIPNCYWLLVIGYWLLVIRAVTLGFSI